ncbi:MAG: hypothetical protein ABIC36_02110 [bacterium]
MNKKLLQKLKNLKKDDSFLITVTVFNKRAKPENKLDTFLFINNFLYTDFVSTKKMINKLIDDAKKK